MKAKQIVKIALAIVTAIYIIEGLYLSFMLNTVVNQSYADYGFNNPYSNIISDEFYSRCCDRAGFRGVYTDTGLMEKYRRTIPFVLHWFVGGKAVYIYSYEIYENGHVIGGAWRTPVWFTMDFTRKPWVTDAYQVP